MTDSQVGAVQIVDDNGVVLAASNGAPHAPLATTVLSNGRPAVSDASRILSAGSTTG